MKKQVKMGMLLLCCLMVIAGCGKKPHKNNAGHEETVAIKEGEYAASLPFEASTSRIKHSQISTNLNETMIIGSGLMNLSKEYFSPDQHSYKEGQFLTYDVLDATGQDHVGLLGRTTESNPNGMNLPIDTPIETDGGTKKITPTDVLLIDIYELDWYDGKDLEGISLGIVLNDKIGDSINPDIVKDDKLRAYGEEVGRKTVSYLRKNYPEIGQKTPIYVALYKESGVNTVLPGTFIEEAYFKSKTIGEYSHLDEAWALFPSAQAKEMDADSSNDFDQFIKEIKRFFPEDTSVIGTGKFVDGYLDSLSIKVTMHAKTWAEANAMIQKVNSSLALMKNKDVKLKVNISSDDVLIAAIEREKESSETTVIQLID